MEKECFTKYCIQFTCNKFQKIQYLNNKMYSRTSQNNTSKEQKSLKNQVPYTQLLPYININFSQQLSTNPISTNPLSSNLFPTFPFSTNLPQYLKTNTLSTNLSQHLSTNTFSTNVLPGPLNLH